MHHTLRYQVGQSIAGRFYIHEIRLGGMGEVYLCFDKEAREPVALKTFQTASQKYDDIKNLFNTEVLAWIKIGKHPNIVRCYWMDYLDAHPFMALEWIFNDSHYGITLRDWLCSGALDMQLALSFAIDICRGLVHANQQHDGIVHRDLKPENILIGQGYLAKITDFGLAQFANIFEYMDLGEQDDNHQRSQEAQVKGLVGTPPYMAPEQWLEDEVIDPRADIYAIGCIMHEMLTGASPFETPLSSASYPRKRQRLEYWRQQHLFNSPTFLSSNFPIRLGEIIQTCLAKQREKRFTSCEHLLQDLTLLYEELFHAPPKTLSISSEPTKEDYLNQGMTYVNLGQYEEALTAYQLKFCRNWRVLTGAQDGV